MIACIYFDGKTAQANSCYIHVTDDYIYIHFDDKNHEQIIWNRAQIKQYDLNGSQLTIKYGPYPHQTIECNGEDSSIVYDKLSTNNVAKKSKRFWLKNTITIAIILNVAFIAICLVTYFIILPWVGGKSVALIPVSTEVQLGNNIAESILSKAKSLSGKLSATQTR